jgi:hypothetical protein
MNIHRTFVLHWARSSGNQKSINIPNRPLLQYLEPKVTWKDIANCMDVNK